MKGYSLFDPFALFDLVLAVIPTVVIVRFVQLMTGSSKQKEAHR